MMLVRFLLLFVLVAAGRSAVAASETHTDSSLQRVILACVQCPITVHVDAMNLRALLGNSNYRYSVVTASTSNFCSELNAALSDPLTAVALLFTDQHCSLAPLYPRVRFIIAAAASLFSYATHIDGPTLSADASSGLGCGAHQRAALMPAALPSLPNVRVVTTAHSTVFRILGVSAASATTTKTIAFLGDPGLRANTLSWYAAFISGVLTVCEQCTVVLVPVTSAVFDESACATEYLRVRQELRYHGADVAIGGPAANRLVGALSADGFWTNFLSLLYNDATVAHCGNYARPSVTLTTIPSSGELDGIIASVAPSNATLLSVIPPFSPSWHREIFRALEAHTFAPGLSHHDPWLPGELNFTVAKEVLHKLPPAVLENLTHYIEVARQKPSFARAPCSVLSRSQVKPFQATVHNVRTTYGFRLAPPSMGFSGDELLTTFVAVNANTDFWALDMRNLCRVLGTPLYTCSPFFVIHDATSAPPPRIDATFTGGFVADNTSGAILAMGRDAVTGHTLDDVWVLEAGHGSSFEAEWRKLWPPPHWARIGPGPGGRYNHTVTPISVSDPRAPCDLNGLTLRRYDFLLVGGEVNSALRLSDVWRLSVDTTTGAVTWREFAFSGLEPRAGHEAAVARMPFGAASTIQGVSSREWVMLAFGTEDDTTMAAVQLVAVDSETVVSVGPPDVVWQNGTGHCVGGDGAGMFYITGAAVDGVVSCKLPLATGRWSCRRLTDIIDNRTWLFSRCVPGILPSDLHTERPTVFFTRDFFSVAAFAFLHPRCPAGQVPDADRWGCTRCPDGAVAVGSGYGRHCAPCGATAADADTALAVCSGPILSVSALALVIALVVITLLAGLMVLFAVRARQNLARASEAEELVESTVAAVAAGQFITARAVLRRQVLGTAALRGRLSDLLTALEVYGQFLPPWLFGTETVRPDLAPLPGSERKYAAKKGRCGAGSSLTSMASVRRRSQRTSLGSSRSHEQHTTDLPNAFTECLQAAGLMPNTATAAGGAPAESLLYRQRLRGGFMAENSAVAVLVTDLRPLRQRALFTVQDDTLEGPVPKWAPNIAVFSRFTALAHTVAADHGGHIEFNAGDRAYLTFNATSNCFTAARSAVLAASALTAYDPEACLRRRSDPRATPGTVASFSQPRASAHRSVSPPLFAPLSPHGAADLVAREPATHRVHCGVAVGSCVSGLLVCLNGSRTTLVGRPVDTAQRLLSLARTVPEPEHGCHGVALCDYRGVVDETSDAVILKAWGVLQDPDAAAPSSAALLCQGTMNATTGTIPSAAFSTMALPVPTLSSVSRPSESVSTAPLIAEALRSTVYGGSAGGGDLLFANRSDAGFTVSGTIVATICGLRPSYARLVSSAPPQPEGNEGDQHTARAQSRHPKGAVYNGPDVTLQNDIVVACADGDAARISALRSHQQWRSGGHSKQIAAGNTAPSAPELVMFVDGLSERRSSSDPPLQAVPSTHRRPPRPNDSLMEFPAFQDPSPRVDYLVD